VHVFAIGNATLDIVNEVDAYPPEDSEVRANRQMHRRGGNSANSLVVLRQLGHRCSWQGVLARDPQSDWIVQDLRRCGVSLSGCPRLDGATPTSYVTLSAATGSRSIVHHRDLPELAASDFVDVSLDGVDWLHWEGRVADVLRTMLQRAATESRAPRSLEIEKPRPGIETCFDLADLLMFSRHFAVAVGYPDAVRLLHDLVPRGSEGYCTWGSEGAWCIDRDGNVFHAAVGLDQPAVDTLGAGDVFNAGVMHARGNGRAPESALQFAVELAARKCCHQGLEGWIN
jgi:ketohexokinase